LMTAAVSFMSNIVTWFPGTKCTSSISHTYKHTTFGWLHGQFSFQMNNM
jgi:hypothetical protein